MRCSNQRLSIFYLHVHGIVIKWPFKPNKAKSGTAPPPSCNDILNHAIDCFQGNRSSANITIECSNSSQSHSMRLLVLQWQATVPRYIYVDSINYFQWHITSLYMSEWLSPPIDLDKVHSFLLECTNTQFPAGSSCRWVEFAPIIKATREGIYMYLIIFVFKLILRCNRNICNTYMYKFHPNRLYIYMANVSLHPYYNCTTIYLYKNKCMGYDTPHNMML